MEESLKLLNENIDEECSAADQYSPLTLAYLGDAVYELAVRSRLVSRANMQVNKLHKQAIKYVSAEAQCAAVEKLIPLFTEKELKIFKRGRNAKPHSMAKNATVKEYLEATGFEAVIGYLYLNREYERVAELIKAAVEALDKE